jgi:hypothetical protein
MPQSSETIATLVQGLNIHTVDSLKKLVLLLLVHGTATRKAELINLIADYMQGEGLQVVWSQLDSWQQAAVAEAVYSETSHYQHEWFVAKYGQAPSFGTGRSYSSYEYKLTDMSDRTQAIQPQGMAMLVECATPALAALIANDSRTKKLCRLAGDRHLMISWDAESKFCSALRKLGYGFPKQAH